MNKPKVAAFAIATSIIMLISMFAGCSSNSLLGSWHNEQLNQLLRFHDDGTVIVRSADGDYEATYIFDKSKEEGVITLNGTAIGFSVSGDEMKVTSNGAENIFVRGDMEITVAEQVTPGPTEISPSNSPDTSSGGSDPSNSEDDSSGDTSSNIDVITGINPLGDALSHKVGISVIGTWVMEDESSKLTFLSDGTCNMYIRTMGTQYLSIHGFTYTYNPVAGKGIVTRDSVSNTFAVNGDELTWYTGDVYNRE